MEGIRRLVSNVRVHWALIVLLGLLAYSNSFDAPFYFDDLAFLENPRVTSLKNIPSMFTEPAGKFASRPLMHATVALNYALGGGADSFFHMDTTGFHVVNVALHLANGVLLYALVIMTAGLVGVENKRSAFIALFISGVFALHPVQTEAVTYIVSRSVLLAAFFYLLGLMLFIKAVTAERRKTLYAAALFAVSLLGMASREDFAMFPVVLFIYDLFFISRFRLKEALGHYKVYIPVIATLGYMVFLVKAGHTYDRLSEMPGTGIPRGEYLITQFNVHWTYVRLLLFPVNQNLDYDYPTAKAFLEFPTIAAFLGYLGLWAVGIVFSRKRPALAFGALWFLVTLLPISFAVTLLDLRLDDAIFEHRLYLPSIGAIGVLVLAAFYLYERVKGKRARTALTSLLVFVPLIMGGAAYARNAVWSDSVRMWADVVEKSPRKARPHNNLGTAYDSKGMLDEAERHYMAAAMLDPFYADPRSNLGPIYLKKGMHREAAEQFEYVLRVDPNFAAAHVGLGRALKGTGLLSGAERHFKVAASLAPSAEAHYQLGVLYMEGGDFSGARNEFLSALAIDPGHADAGRFLEYVSSPGKVPPH